MGCLATVISSVLDHARTHFENPWLWIPTAVGVFTTVVAAGLGAVERPQRADILIYAVAMLLMIGTGSSSFLHINDNLTQWGRSSANALSARPFIALLFANMGTLGLIALLDPRERKG
jgi:hypothetical protein